MKCLAILVNFHCAKLIVEAVDSLAHDPECDWIHVVDNSESELEAAWLQKNLPARVKLIVSGTNIGFGQACNLALEGIHPDSVLLLNPDARLMPGALGWLKKTLSTSKDVGAVGPRVFWDDACHFLMPPSTYPSKQGHVTDLLGHRWAWMNAMKAKQFRRKSMIYWSANNPVRVSALSGGHVLLRYQAVISVSGLFDSAFFMYWEDSDLMRRLNDGGWKLFMEPCAKAVHWYEHSASKDQMLDHGWPAFREKYFSNWFWRKLTHFAHSRRRGSRTRNLTRLTSPTATGFIMKVPTHLHASWVLEVSPSIEFVPSIGRFGHGPEALLPIQLATRFKDRDYYIRVGGVDSLSDGYETFVFNITQQPNNFAEQG